MISTSAELHDIIRTPPVTEIKDFERVPGTLLYHDFYFRRNHDIIIS